MDVTILCSSMEHPVYPYLKTWVKLHSKEHNISLVNETKDVKAKDGRDILVRPRFGREHIADSF